MTKEEIFKELDKTRCLTSDSEVIENLKKLISKICKEEFEDQCLNEIASAFYHIVQARKKLCGIKFGFEDKSYNNYLYACSVYWDSHLELVTKGMRAILNDGT